MGRMSASGGSLSRAAVSRAMKAKKPIVPEPKLLILREKHGNRNFLVKDDEDLFRISLSIVRGRQKQGWWYGTTPGAKPSGPGFTDKDVEKLPPALRADATKKLRYHRSEIASWERSAQMFMDITKALDSKDGRLAWQVLQDRRDHEYEGFSLDALRTEYV